MEKKPVKIAPSLLAADFSDFGSAVQLIEESNADWLHLDVMDGSFVPPITFGAQLVGALRNKSTLPFDVHLMVERPEEKVDAFVQAGADWITVHYESAVHLHRILGQIRGAGVKAGVSIVPHTPVEHLFPILGDLDLVLIMSVNPGYGGQSFIPFSIDKISKLSQERARRGLDFQISVDGGVGMNNATTLYEAGADILVTGSTFFKSENPAATVRRLRGE